MIERLRGIAGAGALRKSAGGDEVHGAMPRVVIAPDSADACAAVLGVCSEEGWSVEVAGGRTGGSRGRPVDSIDVLLSTARLSGVFEYEPDDLTVGVAAGTTIMELRARVEHNRQRVPLDPASDRATVGGTLARAAAGPMRRAWSSPRRQVLGLEVVTGDGRILRVGGRVVKNVAGYDLNKLLVGSAGTLGVITRAHLRLLPMPPVIAAIALVGEDADVLIGAARSLLAGAVQPAAAELLGEPWRLVLRYEGEAEAVSAALEHVSAEARSAGAVPVQAEGELANLAVLESDAALVIRLADLPDRLDRTLAIAAGLAHGRGTIAAHAGDGIARVIVPDADAEQAAVQELSDSIDAARREVATVVIERAPSAILRAIDPWGPVPEAIMEITRALRRQFDPAGILQRGRWLT